MYKVFLMHTSLVLAQSASNTFTDYISSLPMIIEVDDNMVLVSANVVWLA